VAPKTGWTASEVNNGTDAPYIAISGGNMSGHTSDFLLYSLSGTTIAEPVQLNVEYTPGSVFTTVQTPAPVPVPATLTILGAALAGTAGLRRRKPGTV
jgi:phosphoribosylcarboxyaminoimidazole (NCAIR) mutase